MKINFNKLQERLKPFEVNETKTRKLKDNSGTAKVIHYIWTHTPTAEIDFDSFTLKDVENATNEIENLPHFWHDTGESFICDPDNMLVLYDQILNLLYELPNSKNRKFLMEEDDFFI